MLLLGLLAAAPLRAQSGPTAPSFGGNCTTASTQARDLCYRVAEAVRILGARTTIALDGGNPVPGTASTLGMRLESRPHITIAARITAVPVELPGLGSAADPGELDFTAAALALHAGVGLFGGFTLGPTIGGFGSVDLLAGLAHLRLPAADEFFGRLTSWSAGARLGLLRESFTAPGVSVSALYRVTGAFGFGDPALGDQDAWFRIEDLSGWSVRATASKRLLGIGVTAGAGRDYYDAEALGRVRDPGAPTGTLQLSDAALQVQRSTLFANASFTLMILHGVAELGWQQGGKSPAGLTTTDRLEQAGMYGSLAVRLSL